MVCSIFGLAMVTSVTVVCDNNHGGDPMIFQEQHCDPFVPGYLNRISQNMTPRTILSRASAANLISFAIIGTPPRLNQ